MTPALLGVLCALSGVVLGALVGWRARAWWSPWPSGYAVLYPTLYTAARAWKRGQQVFVSDGYGLIRTLSETEIRAELVPHGSVMIPPPPKEE